MTMYNKGRFMGDLDANIEVFMAQGYDRKKAIALYFESTKDRPDDEDQYSGENRRDDSAGSVRSSSEYDDQRRRYRAARESFHKGMTTNSKNVAKRSDSNKHNIDGRSDYDEYNLYSDVEEFTSSDIKTLIEPNPLQFEKQFSSIANMDFHNNSRVAAAFNGTDSVPAKKNQNEKKSSPVRNSLHLSTSQPPSKSSNTSSNVSTPFANMPKFKVSASDEEGSDSEYGGEIKYYDLNKWNRKDNRSDGADFDLLMSGNGNDDSNLRRVGSLTELLALKEKSKPAAPSTLAEAQKPHSSRQQQQQSPQQQQPPPPQQQQQQQQLRGQAINMLHGDSGDYTDFGQEAQKKSSQPISPNIDESEIQWLISIGYSREQAVLMYLKKTGSDEASVSREMNGFGKDNYHAMQQLPLPHQHQQVYQQGRSGNSVSGRDSSRHYYEAQANNSLKGPYGSSLPSDTADRFRAGSAPSEVSVSPSKKSVPVSMQFEMDHDLVQLMRRGYTREQAFQSASVHNRHSQKIPGHSQRSLYGGEESGSVVGHDNDGVIATLMSKGYTLEQAQQLLHRSSTSPPQQPNRQDTSFSEYNNRLSYSHQQRNSLSHRSDSQASPPQYIDYKKQQQYMVDRGDDTNSVVDYHGNNYLPQPPPVPSPFRPASQTYSQRSHGPGHNTVGSRYMKSIQSLSDNEATKIVLLLSEQEASYGTNMYDSLTEGEAVDVDRQVSAGVSTEDAILSIFRRKIADVAVIDQSRSETAQASSSLQRNNAQKSRSDSIGRGSASPAENDVASVSDNATVQSASTRPESLRHQPTTTSGERAENRYSKKSFFGFHFPFSSKSRSPESNRSPGLEPDDREILLDPKRHSFGSPNLSSGMFSDNDVATLMALGFTREQAIEALHSNSGDVKRAALRLLSKS
eukprot:gene25579-33396_t